jgi:hypothetical protein
MKKLAPKVPSSASSLQNVLAMVVFPVPAVSESQNTLKVGEGDLDVNSPLIALIAPH